MRTHLLLASGICAAFLIDGSLGAADTSKSYLGKAGIERGIVCVIGEDETLVESLSDRSGVTVFVQARDRESADTIRQAAESQGLLGTRIFVAEGDGGRIHLADNVADWVVAPGDERVGESEILRVLRPRASGFIGEKKITKPVPDGYDDWSHPFHGPDNNPQSDDRFVQGRFRTQFIAAPKFSPMPEQTVIGGGRMYKAMGHIAHKANQNENLNTVICVNAFNGTILWKRPLPDGFMIHRNTMIATEDGLIMGNDVSCKFFDGETGEVGEEITVPAKLTDGPVWKWMGMDDGVLYALVGNREVRVETQESDRPGMGHWPWGMWQGHDYTDPNTSFGFGRTLVAIDLKTRERLWHFRADDFLDARAVVMTGERIFCYVPEKFIVALDRKTGKELWRNSDADLLAAIGPDGKAQHYITGYATTSYLKGTDEFLFFAGPQRERLVAAHTKDGSLAWTYDVTGNLQLVLRDDAIYAAGPQNTVGVKLDYATGKVLAEFPARRACTRATGCVDSIFYRASGGTVRVLTDSNTAQHIAPMRPPCQDGVLISNGHLYWGPWMCGCQLSLYGNIGLAPVALPGKSMAEPSPEEIYGDALVRHADNLDQLVSLNAGPADWTRYRGNDARTDVTPVALPGKVKVGWQVRITGSGELPTAPVAAGGLVFIADRAGCVRALDAGNGEPVWKSYTGGAIYYPPAISDDRLFAGSADGKVYAFEAKTGRLLWTFRVGPQEQVIPVFGKLVSSWPVAGGVVVKGDTVYAAAGITHYDGTFVVALDAKTGVLKRHNTTSGVLSREVDGGISMQGNLRIVGGELRFLGGGVYETARYDLATLACLNEPKAQVTSQWRTAFYPYYPEYNKYVSLAYTCDDGRILSHDANYEGIYFNSLSLEEAPPAGAPKLFKDAAGEFIRMQNRRRGNAPQAAKAKVVWQDKTNRRFHGFVVAGDRLLAVGHPEGREGEAFLAAINIADGSDLWLEKLPAPAVKGGAAIDAAGRIFVALEGGVVMGFAE